MNTYLKNIILTIFIAANFLVVAAMIFCAYTCYIHPAVHPNLSFYGMMFPFALIPNVAFIVLWLIFKRKLVVIPLFGMLLCAGSIRTFCPVNIPSTPPEGALKILSYNVQMFGERYSIPWEENEIAQYILKSDADIVCLQEAISLDFQRGMELFKVTYPNIHVGYSGGTILICMSKYPIVTCKRVDFPSESNCTYAYDIAVNGDTLLVINNHFESYKLEEGDKDRYKNIIRNPNDKSNEEAYLSLTQKIACSKSIRSVQADSIAHFVERNKGRYIVACGDFNDPPLSYTHHALTKHLNDAYTRTANGPGFSYHMSGMYFRIDNIMVSDNIEPYAAKVDKAVDKSDHYPIFCYVKISRK